MRELEPKTVEYIAATLVELLGPAGLRVVQLERQEDEERRRQWLTYSDALSKVK
jgi:hypothetical protein